MKFSTINGMSRSGNHAIVRWLTAQYEDSGFEVFFHNNATLRFLENFGLRGGGGLHGLNVPNPKIHEIVRHITKKDKRILLVSFEDLVFDDKVKESLSFTDNNFLILRDPMNLFASRIQGLLPPRGKKNATLIEDKQEFEIDKYINQYREFVGETNYLQNKICIKYNDWLCDSEYRKSISNNLGINFTDRNYSQRACSSFGPDSILQLPSKNNEDFLTRYKAYWNEPLFSKIKNNEKLKEISKYFFGLEV